MEQYCYVLDSPEGTLVLHVPLTSKPKPGDHTQLIRLPAKLGLVPRLIACCLILSVGQGCSRQELSHAGDGPLASSQQGLPFHPEQVLADDGPRPALPRDSKAASPLPFHAGQQPGVLPSGTLLTVQLEHSLSSRKVHPGDTFAASVCAPFTMEGHVLVDRGTPVTGHVDSAQSTEPSPASSRGYFRLTLSAMTIEGRRIELQTSSLFTRGNLPASQLRSDGVRVQKGRRLTFRLTAPATLNDHNSIADRQLLAPASE